MRKEFWVIAVVFLLIGAYTAYHMWNKPHEDIAAAESFMTISATDLFKAFQDDESEANSRFLNKVLTINGVIRQVKTGKEFPTIDLNTTDELAAVICNFDPFADHKTLDFAVGQEIKIKGKCSGMLNDVIIDRCVVVQ